MCSSGRCHVVQRPFKLQTMYELTAELALYEPFDVKNIRQIIPQGLRRLLNLLDGIPFAKVTDLVRLIDRRDGILHVA